MGNEIHGLGEGEPPIAVGLCFQCIRILVGLLEALFFEVKLVCGGILEIKLVLNDIADDIPARRAVLFCLEFTGKNTLKVPGSVFYWDVDIGRDTPVVPIFNRDWLRFSIEEEVARGGGNDNNNKSHRNNILFHNSSPILAHPPADVTGECSFLSLD